jgi:hypothetical protein
MAFFDKTAIDNYLASNCTDGSSRPSNKIRTSLKGTQLLTANEYIDWTTQKVRQSDRLTGEPSVMMRRQYSSDLRQKLSKEILQNLSQYVCLDENKDPAINKDYGQSAIERLFTNTHEFDILVAVDSEYMNISSQPSKQFTIAQMDHVLGFIIVELGECQDRPDVWSINLICSRPNSRGLQIKSGLLLGAYQYCIKSKNILQEGILELAGGYTNTSGFFAYTKMGFFKDLNLSGTTCFEDYNNLPMRVDLTSITMNDVINQATDTVRRIVTDCQDDSQIFTAGIPSGLYSKQDQKDLGLYNNLYYKVEVDFNNQRAIYGLSPDEQQILDKDITVVVGRNKSNIMNELNTRINTIFTKIGKPNLGIIRDRCLRITTPVVPVGSMARGTGPTRVAHANTNGESWIQQCWNGTCKWINGKGGYKNKMRKYRCKTKRCKTKRCKTKRCKTKK